MYKIYIPHSSKKRKCKDRAYKCNSEKHERRKGSRLIQNAKMEGFCRYRV